jgi:hypothetical protein
MSTAVVPGARAGEVLRFLLEPTDSAYHSWWPGVHDRFHVTAASGRTDHVGDRVVMDELVGLRRLRFSATVVKVVADQQVVWQLRWGVPLPVRLRLDLRDDADRGGDRPCVRVRHTLQAGWAGPGRAGSSIRSSGCTCPGSSPPTSTTTSAPSSPGSGHC